MPDTRYAAEQLTRDLWRGLGGGDPELDGLRIADTGDVLPSRFLVTPGATASVAAATLAVAGFWRDRGGPAGEARVATGEVGHAFRSERLVERVGEPLPPLRDPVAGGYPTADGWIRLHTNFAAHRRAALAVLGATEQRDQVAAAVSRWPAVALEQAVLEAGGAAAALRSIDDWRRSPQAVELRKLPLVSVAQVAAADPPAVVPGPAPLAGVRVLDLTRVIAGPVCGRFLAAYGAEVLRIDGPALEDAPALIADTTVGKRCAQLDLGTSGGRAQLESLLGQADVVLMGYRPGALERHGYAPTQLARGRPGIVVGLLSAYGRVGPWGSRRGFDSLVQLATGLADEGRDGGPPVPLPAQALDHASGYLLAYGVVTALRRRRAGGGSWATAVSLARTAGWLESLGRTVPAAAAEVGKELVELTGPLGRTRHVPPGQLAGYRPQWSSPPRPLGFDPPRWA
ncbi:MAG: CoA transferase [Micromonosporaceae bacterium]